MRSRGGRPFDLTFSSDLKSWVPDESSRGTTTISHIHKDGDGNKLILSARGFIYLGLERGIVVHDECIQNMPIRDARDVAAGVRNVKKDIDTLQAEHKAKRSPRRKKKCEERQTIDMKTERERYDQRIREMKTQNDGLMPCIHALKQQELNSAYRKQGA